MHDVRMPSRHHGRRHSYNFKVIIPEEATFDRFQSSHAMSLFDLNCKYADVIPSAEVLGYLQGFPAPAAD